MSGQSALAALVRRHDPDRFLCGLFAPEPLRETLWALFAFNHELARAREVASEPLLAAIRLQWWREVVEGVDKRHDVATPLRAAIAEARLAPADLLRMIEARETEADQGLPDSAAWRTYLEGAQGSLQQAAGRVLGAAAPALRQIGAAYGAGGVLRSVVSLARQQRCLLPEDALAEAGLSVEQVIEAAGACPGLQPVLARLAQQAQGWLAEAREARLPREVIAAALPGVLAQRDLAQAGQPRLGGRGLGDRAAVLRAGLFGRFR